MAVLKHSGEAWGVPFWVRLTPRAERPIRSVALMAVQWKTRIVIHNLDQSATNSPGNAGGMFIEALLGKSGWKHIASSGTPKNPAFSECDQQLFKRERGQVGQAFLHLDKSVLTASRLDTAADLLRHGHYVVLCADRGEVTIYFDTESCPCSACTQN